MPGKILQINFRYNVPRSLYDDVMSPLVEDFSAVPGLKWSIWVINEGKSEAGGVHLFDNEESLYSFLEGPLTAQVT